MSSESRPAKPLQPAGGGAGARKVRIAIEVDPNELAERRSWWHRIKRETIDGGPGLLVSVALHVVILFVLGLIVLSTPRGGSPDGTLIATWMTPEDIAKVEQDRKRFQQPVEVAAATNSGFVTARNTPGNLNAGTDNEQKPTSLPTPEPPPVEGLSGQRTESQKQALLQAFGGTRESENAVQLGLNWLTRIQRPDGRWELHQGYDHPSRYTLRTDTGATALALMAYLGAGQTHQQGKYKGAVDKGLKWLKRVQKPNGDLHDWEELGRQTAFYAHAQGTIVLAEAYAMTHDSSLLKPLEKALQFSYDSQNEGGGWQYQPGAVGDLSVTGWQIMALHSARMAGVEVPDEVFEKLDHFLNECSSHNGARYRLRAGDPPELFTTTLTAEGLLCRQLLGWPRDNPALQDGVQWLLTDQNLPSWTAGKYNMYYWYFGTQVMHNMGGPAWQKWNGALRDKLVSEQIRSGKLGGSWHPHKPEAIDHEAGGRLYVTCMALLNLEVYYRHLPLYQQELPPEATAGQ